MTLIEKINADFMSAYKNKEMEAKDFLGVLKTEVTRESKTPTDAQVVAKIKSMVKNAESTNSLSEFELEILNRYLPKQMTDAELTEVVKGFVAENPTVNMGGVMSHLKANFDGTYDGKSASQIVKSILM